MLLYKCSAAGHLLYLDLAVCIQRIHCWSWIYLHMWGFGFFFFVFSSDTLSRVGLQYCSGKNQCLS